MQWEQLTAPDFQRAVQDTGVCLLSLGVLERHSEHLPLGTDMLNAHALACAAAKAEPSVVFPPFYFGQIYEARCFPGAVTLKPTLLLELLQGVLDEIGRNGFTKIILVNGHGGNNNLLGFLAQCSLWEHKPYTVYLYREQLDAAQRAKREATLETVNHGHACECETSTALAHYPELVKMEAVPDEPALALERGAAIPQTFSGISWYANYPEHYAGDARPASAAKGRILFDISVEALARFIAAVKIDQVLPALEKAFFRREAQLRPERKADG